MKNILLLVHDDIGQDSRLQAALDVVRAVRGHLLCLDLAITTAASDPFGDIASVVTERERVREISNRIRIEDRLTEAGVTAEWIEADGDPAQCLLGASALSDLIVINGAGAPGPFPDSTGLSGNVIVKSGRPVLAVPQQARRFDPAGRAMIAWDGSRTAIAAMRAAMPLLRLATSVGLFEADDGSIHTSREEAAGYLDRHGITVSLLPGRPLVESAGETILEESRHWEADYVVMGGFGHSRVRETLFGGATRTMLTRSPIPLLLAHD